MPPKTPSAVQQFGQLLKAPFRRRGRSQSPSSGHTSALSNTAAHTPGPTVLSNVISSGGVLATGGQSPNPQATATSTPVQNVAFQQAIQRYINGLSDDDKAAFQSAANVIEELQRGKSRMSSTHTTTRTQKVQKILQCVNQFLGSVAICIQHHPLVSSLVVGGLHCVLTLALGYIEFFESLTDMMERIGDHLSYLSKYATGSIASQNLAEVQQALVAAYCDLLDFYVKVRKLFPRNEGKLSSYAQGFKRFFRVTWEPFEAQFQSIENKFIHHANIVVRLAGAEYQIHFYDEKLGEMNRKILEWLSPDDYEQTQETHYRKRFQTTGEWLLNDPRFISWKDEPQSGLLWCYGSPGSGKTILASLVIDHLSACHELSANIGMTFIFCNYTKSRSPSEYIRLAMKQLCRRMKPLPPRLEQLYKQHWESHSQPQFQELQDIFLAITQQLSSVFFVLDALDECTLDQRADICEFFTRTVELCTTSNGLVKLFIASRKELDIERAFRRKSFPIIEVEAKKVNRDITLYVEAQIEKRLQDGSLALNNIALKDKIIAALTTDAGGMFLWVEFQLQEICAQISDYGIEKTLINIPKDMYATYERILDAIDKKPSVQRELARKALLFVAYARQPVSITSLALAIAATDHTQGLDTLRSSISTEKIILNACGNLLMVDNDPDPEFCLARFVHFSVHEYFMRHKSELLHKFSFEYELAHREIARMCISFLLILYSGLQDYCTDTENTFANDYILRALPQHLLAANLNSIPLHDEIINLTLSFFGRGPPMYAIHFAGVSGQPALFMFSPSVLALIFNLPDTYQDNYPQALHGIQINPKAWKWVHMNPGHWFAGSVQLSDDRLAMHYATGQLDSVAACQRLFTHGYPIAFSYHDSEIQDIEKIPDFCMLTPLYLVKSQEVARFLIDNGASVNPQVINVRLPGLLEYVTDGRSGGNAKVIQLLLDSGAKLEGEALSKVIRNLASGGKVEELRVFLNHGVDVNAHDGNAGNALQAASESGQVTAIQLLLDHGADVNAKGGPNSNALQAAAVCRNTEAMRVLLDHGADVNLQHGLYGNPLQATAVHGKLEAMQLLLDRGADVNMQGGFYGNALQAAAVHGKLEAIQLLLDHGANVNAQGGEHHNALQAAAVKSNIEAMRLLLDHGADANSQGEEHNNALQASAITSNMETMQVLLSHGVDVNAQSGKFGSALQAATVFKNIEAMQLLLDNGADVNLHGGFHGSVLQAAALYGKIEAIQLLLDHGANVNSQGGEHGSALQAATIKSNIKAMQLLLDNGADVNAQGGEFGSALQASAVKSNIKAMKFLLEHGADVNAPGGKFGNAVQAAAIHQNIEVIRLLLDHGADVNVQGGLYGNALQAAAVYGKVDAMQLLLDRGADVNAQGGFYGNALQAAALYGKTEAVQLLLDRGADVNSQGGEHNNALQAAVVYSNIGAMRLLLDHGADVNAQGGEFGNVLQAAASCANTEAMQLLLDHGAGVGAQGGMSGSALQDAALDGQIEALPDHRADVSSQGGEHTVETGE